MEFVHSRTCESVGCALAGCSLAELSNHRLLAGHVVPGTKERPASFPDSEAVGKAGSEASLGVFADGASDLEDLTCCDWS